MRCKACDRILEEKELLKKDNQGNMIPSTKVVPM
jgi:hypothetical protein